MALEPKVKSFVEDTAEKLGVSTRTIERRLWLAEHLAPEAATILREMGKQEPSLGELMRLARLETDQQEEAASLFASGSIKTMDEYQERMELRSSEAPNSNTCYGDFMRLSRDILLSLENFCALSENVSVLQSEQAEAVHAQINKLREAVNTLAARFAEAR